MKKIIMTLFSAFAILFMLGGQVSASSNLSVDEKLTTQLKPANESEIILDGVEIYEDTNSNLNYIKVIDTRLANGKLKEYDLIVDADNKTYKANTTKNNEYIDVKENKFTTQAIKNYKATVTTTVMDPAVVPLTKTTLSLGWRDNNGQPSHRSRSLSTWAANPSKLGTNWYLVWKKYGNDPNTYQSATAQYVNYDFLGGLPGTTYAKTYIDISAKKNGKYSYYTDLYTTGVAGNLLWIRVSTN